MTITIINSKEDAIKMHRIMWNWIALETRLRQKKVIELDFFNEYGITEIPIGRNYCCEFTLRNSNKCDSCPINWHSTAHGAMCVNGDYTRLLMKGYYAQWTQGKDWELAAMIAEKIANLDEK